MTWLIATSLIMALRLWIWKFFPDMDSAIKDDLSNMIIAVFLFALALVFFVRKAWRSEGLLRSGLELPFAILVAAATASLGWTADVAASMKGLVMLLAYVFLFYILLEAIADERRRQVFYWIFFGASVVVAAFGINDIIVLSQVKPEAVEVARLSNKSLYYILMNKRACSLFGWPNVLASFLLMGIPLSGALFLTARNWFVRMVAGFGGIFMVAALYYTFSFLGWLALLVTTVAVLVFLIWQRCIVVPALAWRYLVAGTAVLAVLFTGVILKKNFQGSILPRKEYARVLHSVIKEHPVRGAGFGAYRFASFKYVTSVQAETAFAHNAYAQIWAETGIAGFLAIIWIAGWPFAAWWRVWRRKPDVQNELFFIAVFAGLAAFLVDNINSFTMIKPNASFFFWVWLAVFGSFLCQDKVHWPSVSAYRRMVMIGFAAAALTGLFLASRMAFSFAAMAEGKFAANAGVLDVARLKFERAQHLAPFDPGGLTAQGDVYLMALRRTGKPEWSELAERSFARAAEAAPNNYYNYLALASIYAQRGDPAKASALITKAMAVSPYETSRELQSGERQK
jgi:hypothetical protein